MIDNKGEDGIPHRVPFVVIDMSTALYAFQALSAALYARRDQPRGRRIEVSLLQAASAMQVIRMMLILQRLSGSAKRRKNCEGGSWRKVIQALSSMTMTSSRPLPLLVSLSTLVTIRVTSNKARWIGPEIPLTRIQ
jgi:crotonobetainyl-CoA:carnitine CoA-transferase CaiB-like acyl-CoA transferase